jgi:hypothetical protein
MTRKRKDDLAMAMFELDSSIHLLRITGKGCDGAPSDYIDRARKDFDALAELLGFSADDFIDIGREMEEFYLDPQGAESEKLVTDQALMAWPSESVRVQ